MGDPRKIRRKYSGPKHPWQKVRIEDEKEVVKKYAPKNKSEIWKMDSVLDGFKRQAKKLSSLRTAQAEKETELLLKKLNRLGLLKEGDNIASVLVLTRDDVMGRRLQTLVFKRGLARTIKQARQFITHGNIQVSGKVITSPSYLVLQVEEAGIAFKEGSALASSDHPERQVQVKAAPTPEQAKAAENKEAKRREVRRRVRRSERR